MHGTFGATPNTSFGSSMLGDMSFQDVSLSSAQQIATLQAKLDKKLGPEYISSRPGGNGSVVYVPRTLDCPEIRFSYRNETHLRRGMEGHQSRQ